MCRYCKEVFTYDDWAKKTCMPNLWSWNKKKYCCRSCAGLYGYHKHEKVKKREKYLNFRNIR